MRIAFWVQCCSGNNSKRISIARHIYLTTKIILFRIENWASSVKLRPLFSKFQLQTDKSPIEWVMGSAISIQPGETENRWLKKKQICLDFSTQQQLWRDW